MKAYIFPTIVMITALAIAVGAALFTILGFRELFEPSIKITYMAASIEVGKVVAVSVLYQFREILNWMWKGTLLILILIAMAVTSMGVYGYLSSSYQKDILSVSQNDARLGLLDERKTVLENRVADIDAQIAAVPDTHGTNRRKLIATYDADRDIASEKIAALDDEKLKLTLERIDKETEFGAVLLLSKSIEGLDSTKAMMYFILAVIFIFDPMAIALTYAANVGYAKAIIKREDDYTAPVDIEIPDSVVESMAQIDKLQKRLDERNSNDDIMHELSSTLQEMKEDREETGKTLAKVSKNVDKVSLEIANLKKQKPSSPRSDVIDSMRQKT